MLPATFINTTTLRVNQTAIGIFGIAILTAGFSFSALLTWTIRNPIFQADAIHQPCAQASGIGLLTIFYNFIISSSYSWKTPTLLLAIAAGLATIIYTALCLLSHRRISKIRSRSPQPQRGHPTSISISNFPLTSASSPATPYETSLLAPSETNTTTIANNSYQPPNYYENYIRNMYPSSTRSPNPQPPDLSHDPSLISEEEMQRQQMLMLLLVNESPALTGQQQQQQQQQQQSTYHLDWQGEGDETPADGYYAPGADTGTGTRRWGRGKLRPWDGVWRGVTRQRSAERSGREERRREIEMGLR
jgi:hypothetical protein